MTGYICLSKKKRNQVLSNVIGAAAYHNSPKILEFLMQRKSVFNINERATEKADNGAKGKLVKEMTGFTPLMLAIASGGQTSKCV